jgi:hypothetical protein
VTVGHNKDVVCTFTNTREQGSIKVIKTVVGDPATTRSTSRSGRRS